MPKVRITRAQVDEIAEWMDAGLPIYSIAKRLGLPVGVVQYHVSKSGLDHMRPYKPRKTRGESYVRLGRVVRYFTPEEDEKILALDAVGKSTWKIGAALNRGHHAIRSRLQTLRRRAEPRPKMVAPASSPFAITITPTEDRFEIPDNHRLARRWIGTTPNGGRCEVFVVAVGTREDTQADIDIQSALQALGQSNEVEDLVDRGRPN